MLDLMIRVHLDLEETTELYPKAAAPFFIPTSDDESSCCSTPSPASGAVSVLDFGCSKGCVVVSHCCFDLQFPNYM